MTKHIVPDLPYAYSALEPYIDTKTMELHHDKHHAAYVTKLNEALETYPALFEVPIEVLIAGLSSVPEDILTAVRNHGGGHYNHSLFWKIIGRDMGGTPSPELFTALTGRFGSLEAFKKKFDDAATGRFGSGWAWLSLNAFGDLVVHSMPNQDNPLMEGLIPVIGLDVWEHAYYLKYQNRRADYLGAFWKVINWTEASANYGNAIKALGYCFSDVLRKKAS